MCFLYIIQSIASGNFYVGVTENPARRIAEHNCDKSFATKNRGPWKLVYLEKYSTPKEAKQREYQIKQKKRKSYLEWLIKNQNGPLV
ncbi:MAG: GIY-YIG nuclease family protein [bacterium]|nr:GIY-YIG nuclease family protein [bacterium]